MHYLVSASKHFYMKTDDNICNKSFSLTFLVDTIDNSRGEKSNNVGESDAWSPDIKM